MKLKMNLKFPILSFLKIYFFLVIAFFFSSCTPQFKKSIGELFQFAILGRILGLPILSVNVQGISTTPTPPLILSTDSGESISIIENGIFRFPRRREIGENYSINITSNPNNYLCAVSNPNGTVSTDSIVNVDCLLLLPEAISPVITPVYFDNVMAVTTFAGSPPPNVVQGSIDETAPVNGTAYNSRFNAPTGIVVHGDSIYVSDAGNHTIRRIPISESSSDRFKTFTVAGIAGVSGASDGVGNSATFQNPMSLTSDGTLIYVADTGNHCIRTLNPTNWDVKTLVGKCGVPGNADGSVDVGLLDSPVLIENNTRVLVWTDMTTQKIRKFNLNTKLLSTIADGFSPLIDGTFVYYGLGNGIFRVNLDGSSPTLIAGSVSISGARDDIGTSARFDSPYLIGQDGTYIYIIESEKKRIRRLHKTDFSTETIFINSPTAGYLDGSSGVGGICGHPAKNCQSQIKVFLDNILVPDSNNHSIRVMKTYLVRNYKLSSGMNDSSINNITGVTMGGGVQGGSLNFVPNQNAESGGAAYFNGTSDYATFSAINLPSGAAKRTMCAWIFPEHYPSSLGIITAYGKAMGNQLSAIGLSPNGKFTAFNGNPADNVDSNQSIGLNRWTHVCASYDGATVAIYVNGKWDSGVTKGWNTVLPSDPIAVIGGSSGGNYFKGRISDVRIYNRVLNTFEYARLATKVPKGLVAFYPLKGSEDEVTIYANKGTFSGSLLNVFDKDAISAGAIRFDGVTNKLTVTNTVQLPVGNDPRTECAWVKPISFSGLEQYVLFYGSGGECSALGFTAFLGNPANVNCNTNLYSSYSPVNHTWYHICSVYDPSNSQSKLYINGVDIGTTISQIRNTTSGTLYIGTNNFSGHLNADISDVRIYRRVLSLEEIRELSGYHPMQVSGFSFNPTTSNLRLHLKSDQLSYLSDNMQVFGWKDLSGNGFTALQTTPIKRPTYKVVPPMMIGGRPTVYFTANQFLMNTSAPIVSNSFSKFSVINRQEDNASGALSCYGDQLFSFDNSNQYIASGSSNLYTSTSPILKFTPRIVSNQYNQSASAAKLYLNGNLDVSTTSNLSFFGSGYYLGSNCSGSFTSKHLLAEELYFNSLLSDSDRELVECYLSSLYSIPLSHPCK
jgi:hypothetical protein